ncbi:Hypothetical_protein [Hexamita inflata]|uniref:Hypothetical_protein n=1 Tax=Hexamita inflata TaxID=28002 RepID=A0AA86UB38_9EUKA|nr:Hypothetical protein HINF_LOCUS19201 [Hexamita inflata]CAI9950740.1 Hypothetical protein HINF_LOCUS38385 [Hexamita inflata]
MVELFQQMQRSQKQCLFWYSIAMSALPFKMGVPLCSSGGSPGSPLFPFLVLLYQLYVGDSCGLYFEGKCSTRSYYALLCLLIAQPAPLLQKIAWFGSVICF